jgi:hypothetical protein
VAAVVLGCTILLIPFFKTPEVKTKDIYNSIFVTMENMKPPDEPAGLPM